MSETVAALAETVAAKLTLVRLFLGVDAEMLLMGACVAKLVGTVRTLVWFFTGVDAEVAGEAGLLYKDLIALATRVFALLGCLGRFCSNQLEVMLENGCFPFGHLLWVGLDDGGRLKRRNRLDKCNWLDRRSELNGCSKLNRGS